LSGKGGTGKTSIAAALAHLAVEQAMFANFVLADADVDAANLELVLNPIPLKHEDFWGGQVAKIDTNICSNCGECTQICRFDAIHSLEGNPHVDPIACEGCAACFYICPLEAISMEIQMAGAWYHSETHGGPLFHAALRPGEENSGKLVTLIKQHARLEAMKQEDSMLLVDGPPGISCPVISAISGADLALIVTEPSLAGLHDLRRIIETTRHFHVPSVVCINKADLSSALSRAIEADCQVQGIEVLGRIPFDREVTLGMVAGQPVTVFAPESPASQAIHFIWERIDALLSEDRA
jgi:MinD superfamily P-loop ATPase